MGMVRAFVEADIPQVGRLHQHVFPPEPGDPPRPPELYERYLRDVFLPGPWRHDEIRPLVCEEEGAITGFLGVVPFRMALRGQPVWAALCTQFCVDPGRRGMTGLMLLRRHFVGPQDLCITDEANAGTRKIWAWAGGQAVLVTSLYWLRPLRPGQLATFFAAQRAALAPAARLARAPARLADVLLARLPQSHFRQVRPTARGEELAPATMAESLPTLARGRALVPLYEPAALPWYLRRAAAKHDRGALRGVAVRRPDGGLLGWYLSHARRGGTGEVL